MGFCKWIEKILSMLERMWEETFKFGFVELFDGKGMAILSLALSPACGGSSPKGGAFGKRLSGKGFS